MPAVVEAVVDRLTTFHKDKVASVVVAVVA
jgi:hypothetical protein